VPRNAAATSERPAPANAGTANLAAANLARGEQIYKQTCVACHGTDGKGDHGGASLIGMKDLAAAIQTVTAGRNSMPPFGSAFTPEQIRDVSGYVIDVLNRAPR